MKNIQGTEEDLRLYNKNGSLAYSFYKDFQGIFNENIYDKNGKLLTHKASDGFWMKHTRDENGNELTYKNSDGESRGFNTPEYTMEQLVEKVGNFKLVKR